MNRSTRRRLLLVSLGMVGAVGLHLAISYPYFDLLVWPETTVWRCEQNRDNDLLLRAVRSRVLPYSVRDQALCGLMRLHDRQGVKTYLSNDEIDKLMQEFDDENYTFYHLFYRPYINGSINPRLVVLALDPQAERPDRLSAFLQVVEPDLSPDKITQVFALWEMMDSTNDLQRIARTLILRFDECGVGYAGLAERFKQMDRPTLRSTLSPGAGET